MLCKVKGRLNKVGRKGEMLKVKLIVKSKDVVKYARVMGMGQEDHVQGMCIGPLQLFSAYQTSCPQHTQTELIETALAIIANPLLFVEPRLDPHPETGLQMVPHGSYFHAVTALLDDLQLGVIHTTIEDQRGKVLQTRKCTVSMTFVHFTNTLTLSPVSKLQTH